MTKANNKGVRPPPAPPSKAGADAVMVTLYCQFLSRLFPSLVPRYCSVGCLFVVYLSNCVVDSLSLSVAWEGELLADRSTTVSTSVACPRVFIVPKAHLPPFTLWVLLYAFPDYQGTEWSKTIPLLREDRCTPH